MTAEELARYFGRAARTLPAGVRRAERESIRRGVTIAQQNSMGPYSLAQLARMGHPYSRRRPNPPQDPAIINLQSGEFLHGWQPLPQEARGETLVTAAVNTAPHAYYLDRGTRRMIRRPLVRKTTQELAPEREERLERAMETALQP